MKRQLKMGMLAVMVILLLISFTGCAELFDDSTIQAKTKDMLDALLANDNAAAYAMVSDACTQTEFEIVYANMRQLLSGVKSYELTRVSFNSKITNGHKTTQAAYSMQTDEGKTFLITALEDDNYRVLAGFSIAPEENTALVYTGELGHMEGADATQWGILAFSALVLLFVILVLIDCCRQKIKKKVLWILAIVLGMFVVTFATSGTSFRVNFNIGAFFTYSALLRYGDGSTILRLLFPVGAIVYLCLRRKLLVVPTPVQEVPEETAPADVPEEIRAEESQADTPSTEEAE